MRWKTRTPIPITRIISAREVSRLAALIDPAKVVAGGRSDPVARYLDPTILHLVNWEDRLMEEEIFRPILPILTYRTQPLVQLAQRN
jgi:aldehyde dehydrogenase (NAD+)